MFGKILKKELYCFFTKKGNLLFIVFLPILLVTLMSFSLESYVDADYGTFQNGQVYYLLQDAEEEQLEQFWRIAELLNETAGVTFTEVSDEEAAKKSVQESEAFGLIMVSPAGLDYYRSPYNETNGGKIVRTTFEQLSAAAGQGGSYVETVVLETGSINSKVYFTFSGLSFTILFMGLLIAHSIYDERALGTIERIVLSKVGVGAMFGAKIITGVLCGLAQTMVVYLYSRLVLDVNWGEKAGVMFLLFALLSLYSAVFGGVLGMISKTKEMCQSTVMMVTMLCGYLGGAITPLYLLENMKVLQFIVKVSPLYWANQALMSLYVGVVDENTYRTVFVLCGLALLIFGLYMAASRNRENYKVAQQ